MSSNETTSHADDPTINEIILMLRKLIYAPDGSITPQTRLDDLGLDSLDLIEAALELEAQLGRDLPEDALREVQTVGDLVQCLRAPAAGGRLSLAA